jgi:hypothetical protein
MERKGKRNKHKKKTTTEKNTKVIPGCFFIFLTRRWRQLEEEGKLPEASNHSPFYSGGV